MPRNIHNYYTVHSKTNVHSHRTNIIRRQCVLAAGGRHHRLYTTTSIIGHVHIPVHTQVLLHAQQTSLSKQGCASFLHYEPKARNNRKLSPQRSRLRPEVLIICDVTPSAPSITQTESTYNIYTKLQFQIIYLLTFIYTSVV